MEIDQDELMEFLHRFVGTSVRRWRPAT